MSHSLKPEDMHAAIPSLSAEDQELLSRFGLVTGQDGISAALDMDIRHGLSSALGNMGAAVQTLLALLNRHGMLPPDSARPAYNHLLQAIASAATDGAAWVCRSHDLDQSALLALMPEGTARLQ
ncbi:MAG: hypothetical protein J1E80_05615 [Desulfovibrionaceae bacterium]|nr:hypothetical protein [Desulfovibrionaceae bacterium]